MCISLATQGERRIFFHFTGARSNPYIAYEAFCIGSATLAEGSFKDLKEDDSINLDQNNISLNIIRSNSELLNGVKNLSWLQEEERKLEHILSKNMLIIFSSKGNYFIYRLNQDSHWYINNQECFYDITNDLDGH